MKPVTFHEAAEDELDDAISFYETRRAGLGLNLQNEVKIAVEAVQKTPHRWPVYKNTDFRQHSIKRFPYTIYYMDLEDRVWIAAIAHQRRRPGYVYPTKNPVETRTCLVAPGPLLLDGTRSQRYTYGLRIRPCAPGRRNS